MPRVLVTGGCGFIGSNLVAALGANPANEIVVLDDESLGSRANLGEASVSFFKGDVADRALLREVVEGVNTVVHLAAHTRVVESVQNPEEGFHSNVVGTFHLLQACHQAGVERFVNASTGGAILGEVPPPVHEALAPQPVSPYGASKLAAEGYCSAYSGAYGLPCVSLRFSNIYGPGSLHKGSVVAHFLKRVLAGQPLVIYGDGMQKRDYLYIDDLTRGILQAMVSPVTGVIQLGTGIGTPLHELIEIIRTTVGPDYPVEVTYEPARAGEIHSTWCQISRARESFGFDPQTSPNDGIAKTWTWFKQQMADRTAAALSI